MVLRYHSGEEIRQGDRVLYHREPAQIEFVAIDPDNSELEWFVQEYGGGMMVLEGVSGRTFIPRDQIGDSDDLEFVARGAAI
jgi:hypothetical protein